MTTATTGIPLGRLEDQRLEFKSRDALKNPEKIAREVVAMLNTEGGEVWIGLREEGGRAIEIEPIPDADFQKERLHDHLVDTLEPAPQPKEVVVETVRVPGDGEIVRLLRIIVHPLPDRRPYGWLRNGGWNFPIRIGARLRPMSREEVFSQPSTDEGDLATAEKSLIEKRRRALDKGYEGLWLAVAPVPPRDLRVQAPFFEELATNPLASGNRRTGWNFARTVGEPQLSTDAIRWGGSYGPQNKALEVRVEIAETGQSHFYVSFAALSRKGHDIWPFALLEYPTSAFRILKKIFIEQTETSFSLLADLALLGARDRRLAPGSPGDLWFDIEDARSFEDGDDLVLAKPLVFDRNEVIQEPDRCAYRLLEKVYQGFGYRENAIPREFDQSSGRLILRE